MNTYKAHIPSGEKYINNIEIDHINRLDTAQFFDEDTPRNQHDTICRPLCGQTQAFWSADKRNGGGAVENRTA